MLNERYRDSRGDRFPSSAILFERQAQNLAIAHEVVRDNKVIPGPRSDRPVSIETPCELLLAISFLPPEHYVPPTFQQTIPAVSKTTARGSGGGTDADEGGPITPRRSGRLSQAASREHTHQVRIVVSLNPNSDPDSVINFTTSPDHDSSPSSSSPISGESYLTDEGLSLEHASPRPQYWLCLARLPWPFYQSAEIHMPQCYFVFNWHSVSSSFHEAELFGMQISTSA